MLINMAAEGNISVKHFVQTIARHPATREMIKSILMGTNQEQLTYTVLTVSAEILEHEGSTYPSNF